MGAGRGLRWPAVAALLLLLGRVWTPPAYGQTLPVFEPADCMYEPFFPWVGYAGIDCGYVTVPERRTANGTPATARTLRLATVILRSFSATPAPDPLVVAQGGPGGSTIDTYVDLLSNHPLRDERDIVLFDQRGTLYSEPALRCTEFNAALPDLLGADEDEYARLVAETTAACHTRLLAEGVDLGAYNSLENAADVDDVRQALGYAAINFYGVSYGTLLGLHLMRDFPDHLRSVILDGVVPPQVNFITQIFQSQTRAFDELFVVCREDPVCNETYPELERRFFALVDKLNDAPALITLIDPNSGARYPVPLTGDDMVDFLFQMFYISGSPAVLPKVIADIEAGRLNYVEAMYPAFVFDDTFADGMYNSVICAEDADFGPDTAPLDGVPPAFAAGAQEELAEYLDTCAIWQVPALDTLVDQPVISELPTLLLSGQFDPVTPPAFAAAAAATLANSRSVVLPTGGHGIAFGVDACIDELVADFLDHPGRASSVTCDDGAPAFTFAPADLVTVPALARLNSASKTALRNFGLAALLLAGLMSALLVWPVTWLLRKLRGDTTGARISRTQLLGRTLVLGFIAVAFVFAAGLAGVFLVGISTDANLALLAAIPHWSAWLLRLPWLLLLLALGIAGVALLLWGRQRGTVAGRIYYSCLALCAVGYVWVLFMDGFGSVIQF